MRRIKKAKIQFLSLCKRGMNRMPVIYKGDAGAFDWQMLVKAADSFDEKGEILAVVYAPETRDAEGDIASADVIKEMAYDAAKSGLPQIDIRHDNKPVGRDRAYVAESFLIQKGDERFVDFRNYEGQQVDVTGGWATVLKIEDPALRQQYRNGEWSGISMGGTAAVETEKADDDMADRVVRALAEKLNLHRVSIFGDVAMTGAELVEALTKNNESLAKTIVEGVTKAIKPDAQTKPSDDKTPPADKPAENAAPVFKGDPTPENLKKHRIALAKHNIVQAIDWANPESISKAEEELAKLDKPAASGGDDAGTAVQKSDREQELEAELAEIRKRSNQATGGNATATTTALSKEDQEIEAAAKEMAKMANDSRSDSFKLVG